MKDIRLTGSNVDILNLIRQDADSVYKERIPVATQENMKELSASLMSKEYEPQLKQFISALINRIGFTFITRRGVWRNKLKQFKKGQVPFGTDVQEIFVDMAKAKSFDPSQAETEVFKREVPNVYVAYHRMNREDLYKVTITRQQLKLAFVNENGLASMLEQLQLSLIRGDEYDEYLLTKQLFTEYFEKGLFTPIVVENPTTSQENAKKLVKAMRGVSNAMEFNSTGYNAMGVNTYTLKENQVIIINPFVEAEIDVEVLAYAFNISKADLESRIVTIDSLGGVGMENVWAFVVDKDWFMIWDTLFESGSIYNPEGLYWNNTLHHWEILSTSQFCNAVAFMSKPTVTAIAITPKTASIKKGATTQFNTVVTGDASNSVIYEITGNNSANTVVTSGGLLTVGADETATTITLKATSFFDETKTDSATITVTA